VDRLLGTLEPDDRARFVALMQGLDELL
jgi:hypothetical protein